MGMADMIREDLLARLREIAAHEQRSVDDVLEALLDEHELAHDPIDDIEDEAEWEAAIMRRSLGDALRPDGSIDFAKLHERWIPTTLEELYPEGADEDDSESTS